MRTDKNGNPDITRVEYTPVSEEARQLMYSFKLHMNHALGNLMRLSSIQTDGEIKRLLAIGITEIEIGAAMAVKAMTGEGFGVRPAPVDMPDPAPEEKK